MTHAKPNPGSRLRSGKLADLDTQGIYTPDIAAADLGTDPVQRGSWHRNGHLINVWVEVQFGTGSSPGSGAYVATLPFPYDASHYTAGTFDNVVGNGYLSQDGSNVNNQQVSVAPFGSGVIFLVTGSNFVSAGNPFTWGDGDRIIFHAAYLADPASLPAGGGA